MAPAVSATPRKRARRNFSHLEQTPQLARVIPVPNLIEIQRKSFLDFLATGIRETIDDVSPIEDYTGSLAVEFGDYVFDAPAYSIRECREKDLTLRAAAVHDGALRQQVHGRDPRAAGLHGEHPADDRLGHVHHQRHGARRRDAARAVPRRLHHGAEGRHEAGLHREPDAGPRVVARARDRQEGPRLRPDRPQAQAPRDDAPARAAAGGSDHGRAVRVGHRRRHPQPLPRPRHGRAERLHRPHAREGRRQDARGGAGRGVQEAAPGRAADARELEGPPARALLRPQAVRPDAASAATS